MSEDSPVRTTHEATPTRRYVYLAGPVEFEDTWRNRAGAALKKMGFEPLDPMRGEEHKTVGKHIESNIPDSLLVMRDLNDLQRCKISAGFVLMNLSTTKEGRKPLGTLFELMWAWSNRVPVVAIMGRECDPEYKKHPWINTMVSCKMSSVTSALSLIEEYFV